MDNQFTELTSDFTSLLRRWNGWYRLRRGAASGWNGLIFALAGVLGFYLVAMISGLGLRYRLGLSEFLQLLLSLGLLGLVAGGLGGFFWPVSQRNLARFFDHYFQLKDRQSTAEEIIRRSASLSDPIQPILARQVKDALEHGELIKPRASFFWPVPRRQIIIAAGLPLLGLLLTVFGQSYFQQVLERQRVSEAIQAEIARLEEIQESLDQVEGLTEEQKETLTEKLTEATRKLEQAETLEQAVAILSQAEKELEAIQDGQVQEQAQALRQLGNQITQSENGQDNVLEDFGQELSEGDPLAAAQELAEIALDELSAEELQKLAEQLEQAAKSLAQSNADLAGKLSQAAEAIQNGDLESAQNALNQAAEQLAQTGSQIAQAEAAQEAATQINQSSERLIQAGMNAQGSQVGQSQPGASQVGQTGSPGQSSDPGAGEGPGESSSNSNNPGQSPGSGAGSGSTDLGNATGPEAGSEPISQNNGPGDGGLRPFVPLDDTQRLGAGGSADVYLPPSGAPGEEVLEMAKPSNGDPNDSSVPYYDVYPSYAEAYRQAVNSGEVPPTLRDLVQKYFSSLEP